MCSKHHLALVIFICLKFILNAQSSRNYPETLCLNEMNIHDSVQVILLGENHSLDNAALKLSLLKYLYAKDSTLIVGFEFPRIYQIYLNDYINHGDDFALKKIKKFKLINSKDQVKWITGIRKLKENGFIKNKLEILCFDITSDAKSISFKTLIDALEYLNDPRLNALSEILMKFSRQHISFEETIKLLQNELKLKETKYHGLLKENYKVFVESIEAIYICNSNGEVSPLNQVLMQKREEYIAKNISQTLSNYSHTNARLVAYTGAFHTSLLEFDTLTQSPSFNFILKNEYKLKTFSLISIDLKKKFSMLFGDYRNFLNQNVIYHLAKQDICDHFYIKKSDLLSSPILYHRTDGVLVKKRN
jgi:hypothetical protein